MPLLSNLSSIARRVLRRRLRRAARSALRAPTRGGPAPARPSYPSPSVPSAPPTAGARGLADRGSSPAIALSYAPRADGHPDPGEVVWAWVPFEEDPTQGKDRPVLVLAEEDARTGGADGTGTVCVALMMTSRDRAPAGGQTVDQHGITWVDIGTGAWDSQGRPSEVRADRLLRLPLSEVRREGAALPRDRFARVADAVRRVHRWDA